MYIFIKPVFMAVICEVDLNNNALNPVGEKEDSDFDITVANDIFLKNFTERVRAEKLEAANAAFNIIENLNSTAVEQINIIFADANEKLMNGIFSSTNGNIEEIKKNILNNEMNYINHAVRTKVTEMNDVRKDLVDELVLEINKTVVQFTSNTSQTVMAKINEEFEKYLTKLNSMKASDDVKKIKIDKKEIIDTITEKFEALPSSINTALKDITDRCIATGQEKCIAEDKKIVDIAKFGSKKLEMEILKAINTSLTDNYADVLKSVEVDVKEKVEKLIETFKEQLALISSTFTNFFDMVGRIIQDEEAKQLESIKDMLIKHNDKLVEDLLS